MESYFKRLSASSFMPSEHVGGSWNLAEQHIAAPMGLLAHLLETDHAARGGSLKLLSINYDILGVLPLEAVDVSIRVLRPGRTIELVEATVSHNDRPALVAKAWFLAEINTEPIAGTHLEPFPSRDTITSWAPKSRWPGKFIASLEAAQIEAAPGKAKSWVRATYPILADEESSPTAAVLGVIDVSNGTTPRVDPKDFAFPNLDLKVSFFRPPVDDWIGLDTDVSFGANGFGLTSTILHDELGPIGVATQALTLRPL